MGGLQLDSTTCNGRTAYIIEALALLRDARRYAEQLARDPWDFAEEKSSLRRLGLSNSDLRWLICKGFVEHGRETSTNRTDHREFRRDGGLRFSKKSCFILTKSGLEFLHRNMPSDLRSDWSQRPTWDRDLQELRVGEVIVKQFKVPAPNQETVLAVFEEEGWPVCIDDPLVPDENIDPKRRLHDTINSLNRNQRTKSIRFHGNGSGSGIRWELVLVH
ncbi:MAG: hypothetical protein AAGG48_25470 [Planctomycetota bacterium]